MVNEEMSRKTGSMGIDLDWGSITSLASQMVKPTTDFIANMVSPKVLEQIEKNALLFG